MKPDKDTSQPLKPLRDIWPGGDEAEPEAADLLTALQEAPKPRYHVGQGVWTLDGETPVCRPVSCIVFAQDHWVYFQGEGVPPCRESELFGTLDELMEALKRE
ncbi:hypothetical protein [Larkinella soli]|uniref:hypothetical protein n=1 Tax=Larkinella soli TaxID=1770527 RepID=UPI000FFB0B68|nr:hypothetical protein [Larkinella soli]